jgi:hypothetical protein
MVRDEAAAAPPAAAPPSKHEMRLKLPPRPAS